MPKVEANTTYMVYGFMLKDLKLRGKVLAIYATIHGYTEYSGIYFPKLDLLADLVDETEEKVQKVLDEMVDVGLIEVFETPKGHVGYIANYTISGIMGE